MRFGVADLLPPSPKLNRLLYAHKRPMAGTIRPKGTYEERTRKDYVEKKQKNLEESLRIVAMRKMVLHLDFMGLIVVAGDQEESRAETKCALGQVRKIFPVETMHYTQRGVLSTTH